MIPSDAFLRRLPTVLDSAQTVQLEALVFAADAIDASLASIRQITAHHREKLGDAPGSVKVGLFVLAWTIVDSAHVVRQLLKTLDYGSPRALAFHDKFEAATVLRNKMDHLAANAENLGSARGRPPLFGVLTYICIPDERISKKEDKVTVTGGMTVVVTAGRFITEGGRIDILNPAGRQIVGPVFGFRLQAFDAFLELEEVERDLRKLISEVNDWYYGQAIARAREISEERQIPIERVMANPPGGVVFFLAFKYGRDPGTPTHGPAAR